jgi:hypothetical protein
MSSGAGVPSVQDEDLRRALSLVRFLRDPALTGLVLMLALVAGGFVAVVLGWRGAARAAYVPLQVPALVSGGFGGLALIGVGVALFDLQQSRRRAAREQRLLDDTLDELAHLMPLGPQIRERARGRAAASP